jgi:hypothetical protein
MNDSDDVNLTGVNEASLFEIPKDIDIDFIRQKLDKLLDNMKERTAALRLDIIKKSNAVHSRDRRELM